MRVQLTILIVFISASFIVAHDTDRIPNLQRPAFYVYTSGQPTEKGFEEIADLGIKTVINVRQKNQMIQNEEELVKKNNMVYYWVPFQAANLKPQVVEHFAKVLSKAKKPVLIHCGSGNNVGGLWFVHRVLHDRIPLVQALKEGRKIGMRRDLEDELFFWLIEQKQSALILGNESAELQIENRN